MHLARNPHIKTTARFPTMRFSLPYTTPAINLPDRQVQSDLTLLFRETPRAHNIPAIEGAGACHGTVAPGTLFVSRCVVDGVVGRTGLGWGTARKEGEGERRGGET